MDEVEFKMAYNAACNAVERVAAPETKQALLIILQMINAQQETLTDMQAEDDC